MNLKELKEAIDRVYEIHHDRANNIEVCIPNNQSSYGGTSVTYVRSAHKGFDWDGSKFFIHPSVEMIENPKEYLEMALGGNMNISTLTLSAWEDLFNAYAEIKIKESGQPEALELLKDSLSHIEDLKSGNSASFPLRRFKDECIGLIKKHGKQ